MRIVEVLHNRVLQFVPSLHETRAVSLAAAVGALAGGASLSVTALGRRLESPAFTKHNIKRMDRLLSNPHLHRERLEVYRTLCHTLCRHLDHPIILVDWSDIVEQNRVLVIRAALATDGRAIPLFEAVYPLKAYNSPATHRRFLDELKTLLPAHCRPIVITDAGFRGPWFKAVEALGWFWLGRIRNMIKYRLKSRRQWRASTDLYYRATSKPVCLGPAELSHKHPYACYLHLYKKRSQHRHVHRSVRHLGKHTGTAVFLKQQRDPWLVATNLPPEQFSSERIVALYGKRMQIEACFRDLKSDQFGFGLSVSRSRNIERLNILLLIAALTTLCLWWIGLLARECGWHRQFQANTVVDRHVLSVVFLGLAVLQRFSDNLSAIELARAHRSLLELLARTHEL